MKNHWSSIALVLAVMAWVAFGMGWIPAKMPESWFAALGSQTVAAWVQALGSIGAIAITGWALIRQEKRQAIRGDIDRLTMRGDQLEALAAMSRHLERLIGEVRFDYTYFALSFSDHDFWMVQDAFAKVLIHDLRDDEIAAAVMILRYQSDALHRELRAYHAAMGATEVSDPAFRLSNEPFEGGIRVAMGEAMRAHLTLEARLAGVRDKLRAAEARLR